MRLNPSDHLHNGIVFNFDKIILLKLTKHCNVSLVPSNLC